MHMINTIVLSSPASTNLEELMQVSSYSLRDVKYMNAE